MNNNYILAALEPVVTDIIAWILYMYVCMYACLYHVLCTYKYLCRPGIVSWLSRLYCCTVLIVICRVVYQRSLI